jgi:hypothetical protein
MSSRLPSIVKLNAPSTNLKSKNENRSRNAAGAESLPHLTHANNSPSHQRKQKKKKKATYEEGIRSYSRVGKLLSELGGQNDWCSMAILRQQMAVVIQSVFRGFMVRKRWRKDPQAVVDSLHAKMEKERTAQQRRAEAIKKLEAKTITSKQKQKWGNKLAMAFGGKGSTTKPGAGGGKWGKLGKNLDIARSSLDGAPLNPLSGGMPDQESGSDYSDLELDNIAAIKLRAVTPPWQKTDESKWQGQFQKLQQKVNRGNLDIFWNTEETEERLQGIIERRHQRHTGGKSSEELKAEEDAPLSHTFITDLLQAKYTEKWSRLRIYDPNSLQGKGCGNFSQSQGLMDPSLIKLNRTRHLSPDDDA